MDRLLIKRQRDGTYAVHLDDVVLVECASDVAGLAEAQHTHPRAQVRILDAPAPTAGQDGRNSQD